MLIYMCIPAALSAYLSSTDAFSHCTTAATTRDLYLTAIEQYKLYIYNIDKIHIQHTLDQRYVYDITVLQSRYGYWLRDTHNYDTYDTGGISAGTGGEGDVSSSSSSGGSSSSGSRHQETDLKRSKNLKDRVAESDVYIQRVYNKLINGSDNNSNNNNNNNNNNKTMINPLFYTTGAADVVAMSTGPMSSGDRLAEALNPFYMSSNTCIFPISGLYE